MDISVKLGNFLRDIIYNSNKGSRMSTSLDSLSPICQMRLLSSLSTYQILVHVCQTDVLDSSILVRYHGT